MRKPHAQPPLPPLSLPPSFTPPSGQVPPGDTRLRVPEPSLLVQSKSKPPVICRHACLSVPGRGGSFPPPLAPAGSFPCPTHPRSQHLALPSGSAWVFCPLRSCGRIICWLRRFKLLPGKDGDPGALHGRKHGLATPQGSVTAASNNTVT